MKKVILAAAAFAALSINAKAQAINTSDVQNFSVSIDAQDMIEITPGDASAISYATGSSWSGWDNLVPSLRVTDWTINATHGYTFSVTAVPQGSSNNLWLKNSASVNDANKYLRSNRFGISVANVVMPSAGMQIGNIQTYTAGTEKFGYPAATEGLTGDKQLLGETTTHGALGQTLSTILSFYPAVYDGLSGTYNGTLAFTAELKP
ncbi:MAG TPA: hypothetical protein VL093_14725 [Flavipsychrobacter sp.]|nr:hypothetical protein [Flavipsychrobacter sp.]